MASNLVESEREGERERGREREGGREGGREGEKTVRGQQPGRERERERERARERESSPLLTAAARGAGASVTERAGRGGAAQLRENLDAFEERDEPPLPDQAHTRTRPHTYHARTCARTRARTHARTNTSWSERAMGKGACRRTAPPSPAAQPAVAAGWRRVFVFVCLFV